MSPRTLAPAHLVASVLVACLMLQLIGCSDLAANNNNAAAENSLGLGLGLEEAQLERVPQLKRSGQPNIILLVMKLYEPFIPKQIMEAIGQQAGPLGDQWTQQLMSMPGFEQFYTQFEGFVNTLSNMGGAGSLLSGLTGSLGGGQLSDLASSFGRR